MIKILDLDMVVAKTKEGKGREKYIIALKDIYTKHKVLAEHIKGGITYLVVETR